MDLEKRVEGISKDLHDLGQRVTTVERDVAIIKSNYATKADVLEAKNSTIMWVVSAVFLAQVLPLLLKTLGM